ncbi:MAG: hypothetical protein Q7S83_00420 [bacterium]|nr:hypothetical protein [bacterium]
MKVTYKIALLVGAALLGFVLIGTSPSLSSAQANFGGILLFSSPFVALAMVVLKMRAWFLKTELWFSLKSKIGYLAKIFPKHVEIPGVKIQQTIPKESILRRHLSGVAALVVLGIFVLLVGVVVVALNPAAQLQNARASVISPAKTEKVPAEGSDQFKNRQYDLLTFYADGSSRQYKAGPHYTDITVSMNGKVVPLGDTRDPRYTDLNYINYNPDDGLIISPKVLPKNTEITFRGVSETAPINQIVPTTFPTEQDYSNAKEKILDSPYFLDYLMSDDRNSSISDNILVLTTNFLQVVKQKEWVLALKAYCIISTKTGVIPFPSKTEAVKVDDTILLQCKGGKIIVNTLAL